MTEKHKQEAREMKVRQRCSCTFGISPACPAHRKTKRDRRPSITAAPEGKTTALDNRALAVRLHETVHGSDENCTYGGIGCPVRRDINIVLQQCSLTMATLTLSSRDKEIREVLEGLRRKSGCWCDNFYGHENACLAARGLWERVRVSGASEMGSEMKEESDVNK